MAQRLLSHMNIKGLSPNEDILNSLLGCCCELEMYADALNLLESMMKHGHLPKLDSFMSIVCGLYAEGNAVKAQAAFSYLLHRQYNYDEVAWKVLIDGLLKKGLVDGFSELFSLMEKKGCFIHPKTYTMLIEGLDGS
ncbi:unnamed protein product [Linum trigynum]